MPWLLTRAYPSPQRGMLSQLSIMFLWDMVGGLCKGPPELWDIGIMIEWCRMAQWAYRAYLQGVQVALVYCSCWNLIHTPTCSRSIPLPLVPSLWTLSWQTFLKHHWGAPPTREFLVLWSSSLVEAASWHGSSSLAHSLVQTQRCLVLILATQGVLPSAVLPLTDGPMPPAPGSSSLSRGLRHVYMHRLRPFCIRIRTSSEMPFGQVMFHLHVQFEYATTSPRLHQRSPSCLTASGATAWTSSAGSVCHGHRVGEVGRECEGGVFCGLLFSGL